MRVAAMCLGLCVSAGLAHAGANEVLLHAATEARNSNYQGVMVYRSGSGIESMRVVHGVLNGVEHERIVTLTGAQREVVRVDGKVVSVLPNSGTTTLRRPSLKGVLSTLTAERLAELSQWYEIRGLGQARVAGRVCNGVRLVPKDAYRYGLEVWADEIQGVPLRVAMVSAHGVLEEAMFTEVQYPKTLQAKVFEPELTTGSTKSAYLPASTESSAADASPDLSTFPLRLTELPPGYKVSMRERRPATDTRAADDHLLISDGIASLSVFATAAIPGRNYVGMSYSGGVYAYGRTFGPYQVTIVGEAPPASVRLVGDKMQINPAVASAVAP